MEHRVFHDIVEYLHEGDCLVLNNTKVIPARLMGTKKDTGATIEVLLLKRRENDIWETLVKPGKKAKPGTVITFGDGLLTGTVVDVVEEGNRLIQFSYEGIFEEVLDKLGEMPLPPYITHKLQDKNRYQTVYAKYEGSAAAPTAGLHFTKELLAQVEAKGVKIAYVTLHVGLGTFRPVKEENVLEHHSNVDPEQIKDEKLREQMKLATENWDYPIVVTTNVQLFESMFSNKPSVCRKLHNIVNSVLILDEVQTLPMGYLQPIVDSLKTYNSLFKVSVLFTTASQPVLSGLIEGCNPMASFQGIKAINEIIPKDFGLHERLRRVKLDIDNSGKSYDEVAEMLKAHKRVLCIVNTRKDAKELYERLPQEGITLHLSKMMCPAHISETIEQIKTALKDDDNEIIRVVSTQLIEAGVDIDFPIVFRQEAGLDSVLQAAGRCNREGKKKVCTTYVFSLAKEHNLPKGGIQNGNNARLSLDPSSDWFAPETMSSYFRQLYCRNDSFDRKDIKHYLYDVHNMCFASAAEKFRLIEDAGNTVVVCWKNSMELVQELLQNGPSYLLMKKISKYCVNIYQRDFEALCKMGVVTEKREGLFVVDYAQQYDEHIGLRIDNNWANESLII